MGACISGWRHRVVISVSRLGISAIAGTGAAITPAHMSSAVRGTDCPAVLGSGPVLVSTCSLIGVYTFLQQLNSWGQYRRQILSRLCIPWYLSAGFSVHARRPGREKGPQRGLRSAGDQGGRDR